MGRVLIVDDDTEIQELVSEYLSFRGQAVEVASTVQQALSALESGDVEVLVVDVRLPDGQGVSLIRQARQRAAPPVCIAMTAMASTVEVLETVRAGAVDCLLKPFRLRELQERISACEKLRQQSAIAGWEKEELALYRAAVQLAQPEDAEPLLGQLGAWLRSLPGVEKMELVDISEADAWPLGSQWAVRLTPATPLARPAVRAVHEALVRLGL